MFCKILGTRTGWALGVTAYYLLIGLFAVSITELFTDNVRFAGFGSVLGYEVTMFSLRGIP